LHLANDHDRVDTIDGSALGAANGDDNKGPFDDLDINPQASRDPDPRSSDEMVSQHHRSR
jgi:hypothetical protein